MLQVGAFPHYGGRWAEWNGKFRDTVRSFIKGSEGPWAQAFASAVCGSPTIYSASEPDEGDSPWLLSGSVSDITRPQRQAVASPLLGYLNAVCVALTDSLLRAALPGLRVLLCPPPISAPQVLHASPGNIAQGVIMGMQHSCTIRCFSS